MISRIVGKKSFVIGASLAVFVLGAALGSIFVFSRSASGISFLLEGDDSQPREVRSLTDEVLSQMSEDRTKKVLNELQLRGALAGLSTEKYFTDGFFEKQALPALQVQYDSLFPIVTDLNIAVGENPEPRELYKKKITEHLHYLRSVFFLLSTIDLEAETTAETVEQLQRMGDSLENSAHELEKYPVDRNLAEFHKQSLAVTLTFLQIVRNLEHEKEEPVPALISILAFEEAGRNLLSLFTLMEETGL